MKKIIVLFKTHLDIGFTAMANEVVENYLQNYLPNAMKVARQMRGEKERFIWTTGSWLIEKFLEESPERGLLEEAIAAGDVRWHGLPFTTHSELMDTELFRYGLSISERLNCRFGMNTIAAKMTDVPGHTRAIIPHMVNAGIQFLHIGVNPASTRPDVPTLFRWKAVSGEEMVVMYNNDYGELTPIGDGGVAVCFAHTGDNKGPQSVEEIRTVYRNLHEKYPEAEICAGTLEDVAREALLQEHIPVIDQEIGDSWIHGAGSDPKKMSQYRALLRQKSRSPKENMQEMYKHLLLVPEHTWGLNENVWLGKEVPDAFMCPEHTIFSKEEFTNARNTVPFRRMEASWEEQREYVKLAVDSVSEKRLPEVKNCMAEYKREPWNVTEYQHISPSGMEERLELAGWQVIINAHGAICGLAKGNKTIADGEHRLGEFVYEVFSQKEYDRFVEEYVTNRFDWAMEDFGKIGVEKVISEHQEYYPNVTDIYYHENTMVIRMELAECAVARYGGMSQLEMVICFGEEDVTFDFAWWGKEPTRVPEASWLSFNPLSRVCRVNKLGAWLDPEQVIRGGNRRMHAVDEGVLFEGLKLETLDAPLVSIGERSLLQFPKTLPTLDNGICCNLHNNVWGTNFRMWYDEDTRFRFRLSTQIGKD